MAVFIGTSKVIAVAAGSFDSDTASEIAHELNKPGENNNKQPGRSFSQCHPTRIGKYRFMWIFRQWSFDEKNGVLECGNSRQKLEPQLAKALRLFLESEGDTITNETLRNALWPNRVVTDNSLYRSIATLRKVLGDDMRDPAFIITVPKVGYQWIADCSQVSKKPKLSPEQRAACPQARSRSRSMAAPIVVICAIAVSLFHLAKPIQASISVCIDPATAQNTAQQLATIQDASDQARVQFQLLDPGSGKCLGYLSKSDGHPDKPLIIVSAAGNYYFMFGYLGDSDKLVSFRAVKAEELVTDELAELITYTSNERPSSSPTGTRGTPNGNHYLAIEAIAHRLETTALSRPNKQLIDSYKQIIEQYPTFAPAYGSLAEAYLQAARRADQPDQSRYIEQAIAVLNQGAEHNPDDSTILSNIGFVYWLLQDKVGAQTLQLRSAHRNLSDPHPQLRLAELSQSSGDIEDSFRYALTAYRLAPDSEQIIHRLLLSAFMTEKLPELKQLSDNALAAHSYNVGLLKAVGHYNSRFVRHLDTAIAANQRMFESEPDSVHSLYLAFYLLSLFDQHDTALSLLETLLTINNIDVDYHYKIAAVLSEHHAEYQRALDILDQGEQKLVLRTLPANVIGSSKLRLYQARARTYLAMGQFEDAYKWLMEAEDYLVFQSDAYTAAEILIHKMFISQKRGDTAAYQANLRAMLKVIDSLSHEELTVSRMLLAISCFYKLMDDNQTAKGYLVRFINQAPVKALSLPKDVLLSDLLSEPEVQIAYSRIVSELQEKRTQISGITNTVDALLNRS